VGQGPCSLLLVSETFQLEKKRRKKGKGDVSVSSMAWGISDLEKGVAEERILLLISVVRPVQGGCCRMGSCSGRTGCAAIKEGRE